MGPLLLSGTFPVPSRLPQRKSGPAPSRVILDLNLLLVSDLQISLFIAGWICDKARAGK